MGPWERPVMPGLDQLFDLNNDGTIDSFEEATELAFISGAIIPPEDTQEEE